MKEGQSNQALSVMGKTDVQKSDSEVGRSTPREREHRSAVGFRGRKVHTA